MSELLRYAGTLRGGEALVGPRRVQLDLTDRCQGRCVACWNNSPLLPARPGREPSALPTARVNTLLGELTSCGVEEVFLSGGGEPSLHPDFLPILTRIKAHGLRCSVNTDLLRYNPWLLEELVCLELDSLTVSLWAADGPSYAALRQQGREAGEACFEQVLRNLETVLEVRARTPRRLPRVKLYNVVTRRNVEQLGPLYELALRLGVEACEFVPLDPLPGVMDELTLDRAALQSLERALELLFLRRHPGLADNLDQFLRRLRAPGAGEGRYDASEVVQYPCLAGLFFSRIRADGSVNYCLKSGRYPIGSILEQDFRALWYGEVYAGLRRTAAAGVLPFAESCGRTCDNLDDHRELARWFDRLDESRQGVAALMAELGATCGEVGP